MAVAVSRQKRAFGFVFAGLRQDHPQKGTSSGNTKLPLRFAELNLLEKCDIQLIDCKVFSRPNEGESIWISSSVFQVDVRQIVRPWMVMLMMITQVCVHNSPF